MFLRLMSADGQHGIDDIDRRDHWNSGGFIKVRFSNGIYLKMNL